MSIFTPFVDSSVVQCGAMQPIMEGSWGIPTLPSYQPPHFHHASSLFPAQQLAAMVPGLPISVVASARDPELAQALYANQLEVEVGCRPITLPSKDFMDVEELEQQLGIVPKTSKEAEAAKESTEVADPAPSPANAKVALQAVAQALAAAFTAAGDARTLPAADLRNSVARMPAYAVAVQAYARPGSFKAAKGASEEVAPFIQLIKARLDDFFVELESPFSVRRLEKADKADKTDKKKKWVPIEKAAEQPPAATEPPATIAQPPATTAAV